VPRACSDWLGGCYSERKGDGWPCASAVASGSSRLQEEVTRMGSSAAKRPLMDSELQHKVKELNRAIARRDAASSKASAPES